MSKIKRFIDNHKKFILEVIKVLLLVSFILFCWLNYESKWLDVFGDYILPCMNVSSCLFVVIFTLLFFVFAGLILYYRINNKCKSSKYLVILLLVCVVYAKYRFSRSNIYYFDIMFLCFAYLDFYALIALAFGLLGIKPFVLYFKNLYITEKEKRDKNVKDEMRNKSQESNPFITDAPIEKAIDDKLDFNAIAEKNVIEMSKLPLDKSFSIGINGQWGTGKTSFMCLMKEALDDEEFIIVDFNPKNSLNASNIQEDFFSTLCSALTPYYNGLSSVFKPYMKALQLMEQNQFAAILSFLYRLYDKDSAREAVEKVLKSLPKKVAIFIEDLDRLFVAEILEIFKLIDVNASFPNIVFITAYDKTIVEKMVKEYMHLGNDSNFTDKFFNYEIIVPLRPYHQIYQYLKDEIIKRCKFPKESVESYKKNLDGVESFISLHITTLRDAKRFVNLFIEDYKIVEGEVDFVDFLLISIIKYKSLDVFRKLYEEKIFIEKQPLEKYYFFKEKLTEEEKNSPYKSIVEHLFPLKGQIDDDNKNEYGRIYYEDTFEIYFVAWLYTLSQNKIRALLKNTDLELIKETVNDWNDTGKIKYFIGYLSDLKATTIENKNEFISYIKVVLLICSKYLKGHNMIISLLFKSNVDAIISNKFESEEEYINLIKDCLKEQPNCHIITRELIVNYIDNVYKDNPIILSREELLEINKKYFKDSIASNTNIGREQLIIFYSCIKDIDVNNNRKVTLDKGCCQQMRDAIGNSPEWYIETFVHLGGSSTDPTFNSIACEPFWEQIFGDSASFEAYIADTRLDKIPKIERVRNFWRLYEKNDCKLIEIKGEFNVQEEINNDLNTLISNLNDLEKIDENLKLIKEKWQSQEGTTSDTCSRVSYSQDLTKLNNELSSNLLNKLNIVYARALRIEIQSEINKIES